MPQDPHTHTHTLIPRHTLHVNSPRTGMMSAPRVVPAHSKHSINTVGQMQVINEGDRVTRYSTIYRHHGDQPCTLKRKRNWFISLTLLPMLCALSPAPFQDTALPLVLWVFKCEEVYRGPTKLTWSEGLETPSVAGSRVGLTRGHQPHLQRLIKLPDANLLNH